MKGADHEIRVVQSVIDRLIDEEPRNSRDLLPTRADTVRALRGAVQRDLDELLNTRNSFADLPPAFAKVRASVIAYGLPDFSTVGTRSDLDHNRLCQAIRKAIETFEPRLTDVSVTVVGTRDRPDRPWAPKDAVRIRIDARLAMDPSPESVAFDVTLPVVSSHKVEVRERE